MKHCLRFKLYDGARLAGEAVSIYLKERAGSIERRLESNRSFAEKQKSTAESVLLSMETYDEVGSTESFAACIFRVALLIINSFLSPGWRRRE